jgi:hypothetical protein
MKEIGTFIAQDGHLKLTVTDCDGYYKVVGGTMDTPFFVSKMFMTEAEATSFASEYVNTGNEPKLLNE